MNTNHLPLLPAAHRASASKLLLAAALATLGILCPAPAQEITGQIYGTPSVLHSGDYTYDVTFQNSSSSMNPVAFIWFAWTPDNGPYNYGGDLMQDSPAAGITTPSGWSANAYSFYPFPGYDGYSIQFTSGSTGLAPGQSVTFQFDSPDSPSVMGGLSRYPFADSTHYPVLYSYYYQTTSETGASGNFTVSLVPAPEPSTLGLLTLGSLALLWSGRNLCRRPVEVSSR
jgi:hypothetical protein